MARELLPAMTAFVPRNPRAADAVSRLSRWDGTMSKNAVEPLVFYAWLREFNRALYADELGNLFSQGFGLRPKFVLRALTVEPQWCDDTTTNAIETCSNLLESTLVTALAKLKTMAADGRPVRRWGEVHQSVFRHALFHEMGIVPSGWGMLRMPADGGNFTINRAATRPADPDEPFADVHGPGFRAIYDLNDLTQSQFVISTGQSGVPFSIHYDDMLPIWSTGRYIQMNAGANELTGQRFSQLQLYPTTSDQRDRAITDSLVPFLETAVSALAGSVRSLGLVVSGEN